MRLDEIESPKYMCVESSSVHLFQVVLLKYSNRIIEFEFAEILRMTTYSHPPTAGLTEGQGRSIPSAQFRLLTK